MGLIYHIKIYRREIASAKQSGKKTTGYWPYFFRWKKFLGNHTDSLKNELPWITFPVIDFLNSWLKKEHRVFEYGGGSSTIYFARRIGELVTVEHHAEWFQNISKVIAEKQITNWKGILAEAQEGNPFGNSISDPKHYVSDDANYKGKHFQKYASAIDSYADSFFDLVLVDGRVRPSCMHHAIPKIKSGGLLILDNSDRSYYHTAFIELLQKQFEVEIDYPAPSPYSHEFTSTTVWRKK
jgi:hypothetical protein